MENDKTKARVRLEVHAADDELWGYIYIENTMVFGDLMLTHDAGRLLEHEKFNSPTFAVAFPDPSVRDYAIELAAQEEAEWEETLVETLARERWEQANPEERS